MVKTQYLVPEIYYKESRDFQYFGRLFDIIFNYCKTNVELLGKLSYKAQSNMVDLVLQTLGFKPDYNNKIDSLYQLCEVWSKIIKNKGNLSSIKTIINSLLNFENISTDADITYTPISDESNCNKLNIIFSSEVKNDEIYLIEKVLDYILPVTTIFQISTAKVEKQPTEYIIQKDYAEADTIDQNDKLADDVPSKSSLTMFKRSSRNKLADITEADSADIHFNSLAKQNQNNN